MILYIAVTRLNIVKSNECKKIDIDSNTAKSYESNKKDIDTSLAYIIYDAPHSLARQSYEDPYLPGIKPFPDILKRNAKINMDGFGIYYIDMVDPDKLHCIKSKHSILNININTHLIDKEQHVSVSTIKNNLYRSIKLALNYYNNNNNSNKKHKIIYNLSFIRNNNFKETMPNYFRDVQPFKYKDYLFCHNGGFNSEYIKYTHKLVKYVDPLFLEKMKKIHIDSKWVFGAVIDICRCGC